MKPYENVLRDRNTLCLLRRGKTHSRITRITSRLGFVLVAVGQSYPAIVLIAIRLNTPRSLINQSETV